MIYCNHFLLISWNTMRKWVFIAREYIRGYYLHHVKFSYFLVSIVKYFYKTTACLKNRAYARSCSPDHFLIWGHLLSTRAKFSKNWFFLPPDTHTYVCYQGVKNVTLTENLACLLSDSKPFSKKSGILSTL